MNLQQNIENILKTLDVDVRMLLQGSHVLKFKIMANDWAELCLYC